MLVLCVAAVLGLLSGGQAAPLTCQNLLNPLENINVDMILGTWMQVGESNELSGLMTMGKLLIRSVWVEANRTSESNTLSFTQTHDSLGQCGAIQYKMTLENNTLQMVEPMLISDVFLKTDCPDCLLIKQKLTIGQRSFQSVLLLSRRREVTHAELETFKKQVECLNLPRPLILNPQHELCPRQAPEDIMDMRQGFEDAGLKTVFENIINLQATVSGLLERFTSMFTNSQDS